MADIHSIPVRRGSRAGDLDDRGYGVGASAGNTADVRCRAARFVASNARDARDAALLLSVLGLDPAEGLAEEGTAA